MGWGGGCITISRARFGAIQTAPPRAAAAQPGAWGPCAAIAVAPARPLVLAEVPRARLVAAHAEVKRPLARAVCRDRAVQATEAYRRGGREPKSGCPLI